MLTQYNRQIPKDAICIIEMIEQAGFEAYIVGGCVRDLLMNRLPHDWDITTSAKPEEVKKIFRRTYDTGIKHGTVTVILNEEHYEVTTYRIEGEYKDFRRPTEVSFVDDITLDLSRRDFTMNAIAYHPVRGFIDPYHGQEDIKVGLIRSVRSATERFTEDALRILRAVRFSAQLGFKIEQDTLIGIEECKHLLTHISKERVRDEFLKICLSPRPEHLNELMELGLLEYIIPEFIGAYDTPQNHPHHIYNVAQHTIVAMQNVEPTVRLRLTMLLHDIGKIYTRTTDKHGIDHFHNHDKKSVEVEKKVLRTLKLDNRMIKEVGQLIHFHDYHIKHHVDKIYVKKMLREIGPELFDDLLKVHTADAKAQNPDKLEPKLHQLEKQRKLKEEVLAKNEPYHKGMMCITGSDLMEAGIPRGKEIGWLLDKALDKIIHHPENNTKEVLIDYCQKLYQDNISE
ncbi:MAG: CCA tRNA nucleotidyltransferase [Cellulosilyticum sp.]|nr:CCA tRNA nucleotidyltransferase [Cellulosilyticum sp.]